MNDSRQSAINRWWTPAGPTFDAPLVVFWRVRVVTGVIGMSMFVLLPIVFLGALFLHLKSLAAAGIVLLAVNMASNAALEAARIWWVFQLGRWTGWKREPIWRYEKPVRYWTQTAMHAAILAVYAAAAVFLISLNLNWMVRQ